MIYRLPVDPECVRTLKDPVSFKDPQEKKRRSVFALVRLSDIPDFPLNPDPRIPKSQSPIIAAILKSAKSNDGNFHIKNRGIVISARSVELDNVKKLLTVDIPEDEDVYGIVDGGHTHSSIRKQVELLKAEGVPQNEILQQQYVKLELLTGVESDLASIAGARNYSAPLKAWGLEAYQHKFDWLLNSLGEKSQHILIREGDAKPYPVMDAIQIFCAVNPILFKGDTPALEAYKNAGKCLSYFIDESDQYGFKKFAYIALDVLKLYDYIRFNWEKMNDMPDEDGRTRRTKATKFFDDRKLGRDRLLSFYFLKNEEVKDEKRYPVEKGCAIPLISVFRILLEEKDGHYTWKEDPFAFFDLHGSKMVKRVMDSLSTFEEANYVGRNRETYEALYQMAENAMLTMEVMRLRERMRQDSSI